MRKFTKYPSNYVKASADFVYCPYCDAKIADIDSCETDKMWDNAGNHVFVYFCPECGGAIEEYSDGYGKFGEVE